MSGSRSEAIAMSRRLLRSFAAAPDPMRQARLIASTLTAADGWKADAREEIEALNTWLLERPPVGALKSRCEAVIAKLA